MTGAEVGEQTRHNFKDRVAAAPEARSVGIGQIG
jgi:hypothetical protein